MDDQALKVPCPTCGQPRGKPCVEIDLADLRTVASKKKFKKTEFHQQRLYPHESRVIRSKEFSAKNIRHG